MPIQEKFQKLKLENDELQDRVSNLSAQLKRTQLRLEEERICGKKLNNAYLRVREIVDAFDTPTAPTADQIYELTEQKARALVQAKEQLEKLVGEDFSIEELEEIRMLMSSLKKSRTLRRL